MPDSQIKINIGCGKDIKEGWVNCDFFPVNDAVIKIDLKTLPLPFPDNSADEILLSHVLEHMENRYDIITDLHRILKKGGLLRVKLPIHANRVEHASFYHQKNFFNTLYNNPTQNYGGCNFELVSIKKRIYPCRARIMDRYYRLLSWLHSLIYFEYDWMLRKR